MDVTFTNVLEGARQYFQGLPSATSSTVSPIYMKPQETVANGVEYVQDVNNIPQSSNSWIMQDTMGRTDVKQPCTNWFAMQPLHANSNISVQQHSENNLHKMQNNHYGEKPIVDNFNGNCPSTVLKPQVSSNSSYRFQQSYRQSMADTSHKLVNNQRPQSVNSNSNGTNNNNQYAYQTQNQNYLANNSHQLLEHNLHASNSQSFYNTPESKGYKSHATSNQKVQNGSYNINHVAMHYSQGPTSLRVNYPASDCNQFQQPLYPTYSTQTNVSTTKPGSYLPLVNYSNSEYSTTPKHVDNYVQSSNIKYQDPKNESCSTMNYQSINAPMSASMLANNQKQLNSTIEEHKLSQKQVENHSTLSSLNSKETYSNITTSNNTHTNCPTNYKTIENTSHIGKANTYLKSTENHVEIGLIGNKQKRESPLDLSVKTVRTTADSTDDSEQLKFKNDPYHNISNGIDRSIYNISNHSDNKFATPKVEFHPNFNVTTLYQGTPAQSSNTHYTNYENRTNTLHEGQNAINIGNGNASFSQQSMYYQNSTHVNPSKAITDVTSSKYSSSFSQNSNVHSKESNIKDRKRSAEIRSTVPPSKYVKMDAWRQTIDQQIEQKLSTYKREQIEKKSSDNNLSSTDKKYYHFNESMHQQIIKDTLCPGNYNHSNKPIMDTQSNYLRNIPQYQFENAPITNRSLYKPSTGGANKHVLDLLRNSLENKNYKDNLKKTEHHPIDVPSQHLNVPHSNASTAKSLDATNTAITSYLPNYDSMMTFSNGENAITTSHENGLNNQCGSSSQSNGNSNLDGLAAFLAARIRTKAELKQGESNVSGVNSTSNTVDNNTSNQCNLKSPHIDANPHSLKNNTSTQLLDQSLPRKKLFNRADDSYGLDSRVQSQNKSDIRSSSETSVFDFRESDSECDLTSNDNKQKLCDIRRERKSINKSNYLGTNNVASDEEHLDDDFNKVCEKFMKQLHYLRTTKKRGRKKKQIEFSSNMNNNTEKDDNTSAVETVPPAQHLITCDANSDVAVNTSTADVSSGNVEKWLHNDDKEKVDENVSVTDNKLDTEKETNVSCSKLKQVQVAIRATRKPTFGDGSAFHPGWEQEVYRYKRALRMPASLIHITRPSSYQRLSTSLPDLHPYRNSPTLSFGNDSTDGKIKSEEIDSDIDSNSSYILTHKKSYDSESLVSMKSLPNTSKEAISILDKLLERYGIKGKRKYKRRWILTPPKLVPKAEKIIELLPTPGMIINREAILQCLSNHHSVFEFRKKTVSNFKEIFLDEAKQISPKDKIVHIRVKSRSHKRTRALKHNAIIKEVFGEDRPSSAPPVSFVKKLNAKEQPIKQTEDTLKSIDYASHKTLQKDENANQVRKKGKPLLAPAKTLLKSLIDKSLKSSESVTVKEEDTIIKHEDNIESSSHIDDNEESKKNEKQSDTEETPAAVTKRLNRLTKIRRKLSSGFDYIRKKKKVKKEVIEREPSKCKRRVITVSSKSKAETIPDIQKEIKSWVLNKGIGETHLHRAARLGYTDIAAYCLEKMDSFPSPKDNAGYTPLHEASTRGHLDVVRLLLQYGANISDSARGGTRPLHEAVENGQVEITRLLLSYGADPLLGTYSGLTPLVLAANEPTAQVIQNHINDAQGLATTPFTFTGPASCFDVRASGFNVLEDVPTADIELNDTTIEFEMSDMVLPNLYTLRDDIHQEKWVLLQDLSNILKFKSKEALLKHIYPITSNGTTCSTNHKDITREFKMSDFLVQVQCCQLLHIGEKINSRASKITLVKYTDSVRRVLNAETITISTR